LISVVMSVILLPLPFLLWKSRNIVYIVGFAILIIGKVIEAMLNFIPSLTLMYISDPVMMAGSILLFIKLNHTGKARYGALFCGIALIATVVCGMCLIYGVSDWAYPTVSIVYYTCFWVLALSYLEMGDYHFLSFVGAFFVILSILICFSNDGALYAGIITEEEYAAAPWYLSYVAQSIAGLFAFFGTKRR